MGNFDQSSALNTNTMERVKIKRKQLWEMLQVMQSV